MLSFLPFGIFHLFDIFSDESCQILNDGSGSSVDDCILQLDNLLERVDQLVLWTNSIYKMWQRFVDQRNKFHEYLQVVT